MALFNTLKRNLASLTSTPETRGIVQNPVGKTGSRSSENLPDDGEEDLAAIASVDDNRFLSVSKTLIYEPLIIEQEQIRVITLLDGEISLVECLLENVSLNPQLTYKALSYCWGDATKTKSIKVNGCIVRITENLEEALRHLRVRELGTFIWVDALCIDQNNVEERDLQVLRMREIYMQAESVIAWLGEDDSRSIAFLEAVARGEVEDLQKISDLNNAHYYLWLGCCYGFFSRPYWRRTWIVQEIVLASDVTFVSETRSMRWEILQKAFDVLRLYVHESSYSQFDMINNLVVLRTRFRKGYGIRLLEALNNSVLLKATDPRDKIYGLLSLAQDGSSLIPSPNYSLPVDTVLNQAMKAIAATERSLDILATKLPWREPESSQPSWYPTWKEMWEGSGKYESEGEHWNNWCQRSTHIAGSSRREFSFALTKNGVITYGIELDVVDGIGTFSESAIYTKASQPQFSTSQYSRAQEIFNVIHSCFFPADEPSPDGWRFVAPLFAQDSDKFVDEAFDSGPGWIDFNAELKVSGQTLRAWGNSLQVTDEVSASKIMRILQENKILKQRYLVKLMNSRWGQEALVVTRNGYLGTIHPRALPGDRICLLHAFQNIVILRPWDDGYKIVGYAFIDGMMYGESEHRLNEENLQRFQIY